MGWGYFLPIGFRPKTNKSTAREPNRKQTIKKLKLDLYCYFSDPEQVSVISEIHTGLPNPKPWTAPPKKFPHDPQGSSPESPAEGPARDRQVGCAGGRQGGWLGAEGAGGRRRTPKRRGTVSQELSEEIWLKVILNLFSCFECFARSPCFHDGVHLCTFVAKVEYSFIWLQKFCFQIDL